MTPKEAYNITREFKGFWGMEKPTPLKYITSILGSAVEYHPKYLSDVFLCDGSKIKKISKNIFNKRYNKYFLDEGVINNFQETKCPTEPVYITSKGITNEDDFYLAEEVIETLDKIKTKDLKLGNIYTSILEKRLIFIGDIKVYFTEGHFNNMTLVLENLLSDIDSGRLFYANNIILLEEEHHDNLPDNISRIELERKIKSYKNLNTLANPNKPLTWKPF